MHWRKRIGFGLASALLGMGISASASAQSMQMDTTVVDINGGVVELGDTLRYRTALSNASGMARTNAKMVHKIAPGTQFVSGTLTKNAVAQPDSLLTGSADGKLFEMTESSLSDSMTQVIEYEVQVTDSPLYFVDNSAKPPIVYQLSTATGEAEYIGRLDGHKAVYGLALTVDGYSLYGVDSSQDELVRFDLHTKETTTVGKINMGNVSVPCLDFDASGTLIAGDGVSSSLIEIDINTGQGTHKTDLDLPIKGGDCAFGADGNVYFMSNTNNGKGALWVVNAATGESAEVANVSDTEFFTGLALSVSGQLFASGNNTDTLWSIDPNTGVGTVIGTFGVPHAGGDLAMTASQKLAVTTTVKYTDDEGEEIINTNTTNINGSAPPIGTGADIGDDPVIEGEMCPMASDGTCVFDADFDTFVAGYLDDVLLHHFTQVEETAGQQVNVRNLTGEALVDYLESAQGVIITKRNDARTAAENMIAQWKTDYAGVMPGCPHINQLLMNIRELLVDHQASADVVIIQIDGGAAIACSLVAQDSTIRYGDKIALGWAGAGGVTAAVEPYVGAVSLDSVTRVTPLEDTVFTYSLYDENRNVVAQCPYTVIVQPACDIGSYAEKIPLGGSTRLLWNANGSDVAEIDNGIGGVSLQSSMEVYPTETTTYTMSIWENGTQLRTCSRTIEVYDPASCPAE